MDELKIIMLSEISQAQKDKCHTITYKYKLKQSDNLTKVKSMIMGAGTMAKMGKTATYGTLITV